MDWKSQIDQTTAEFRREFDALSKEELNWKPNASSWSIAQNIDHLITINRTYFPIFEEVRNGRHKVPHTAKIGFLVNFFGKMIFNASKPDRKKKIKTFPIWEPTASKLPTNILEQFISHQEELKQQISLLSKTLAEKTVISSPANKNIVYRLEKAIEIIIVHEKRHLAQSKEILMQLIHEKVGDK